MRILLTYFTFPPSVNGVARYLGNITKVLTEKGHDVEIVCGGTGKRTKVQKKGKLRIHRLPYYGLRVKEDPEKVSKRLINYITKMHEKDPIDIIEAQGLIIEQSIPHAMALNLVSLKCNIPLVLRFHGMDLNETQKSLAKSLFWKRIVNVCNCGAQAMYDAKIRIEKIETQQNGVDLDVFKPDLGKKWLRSRIDVSEKEFLIGTASRIMGSASLGPEKEDSTLEEKGIIDLIKAFGNSMKDKKDAKLIIAAAPPPVDLQERFEKTVKKIQDLAKVAEVQDKVIIKSFELEEMPLFYNGLDLFVLSSKAEACPMVLTEAMACKIPTVGTSVGGIPEIITNGESGYLVEIGNPIKLGKLLRDLIKSPKKRESVANIAYKNINEKYELKKTGEKVIGVYNSVLNPKRKNGTYGKSQNHSNYSRI
jgi:glycosyltransferase involved in cell wall biosynthesis